MQELEHVNGKEQDLLSKRGPNIGKLQHRMPQTQNSKMHRFREIRRPDLAVMEKGIARLANHRQRLPMFGEQGHDPRPRYGARQPRPARQERPSAPAARLLPCRPTGLQLSIAAHFQVNHIFEPLAVRKNRPSIISGEKVGYPVRIHYPAIRV